MTMQWCRVLGQESHGVVFGRMINVFPVILLRVQLSLCFLFGGICWIDFPVGNIK